MKLFVGYLSMISMGVIASVVLASGTLGPQGVMGALSGFDAGQSASGTGTAEIMPLSGAGPDVEAARGAAAELPPSGSSAPAFKLDYASLILGLVIGVLLSSLASVPWSQIPRRSANWLVSNQANFGYGLLSIAFAALLIYY